MRLKDYKGKRIPTLDDPLERRKGTFGLTESSGADYVPGRTPHFREDWYYKCMFCGEAHRHARGFKHAPDCKAR